MNCQNANCRNRLNWFKERISKQPGYYMESHWYCSDPCLEAGILQRLQKSSRPKDKSAFVSNRARIGFLLLESGVITKEQLDLAVAEQQRDLSLHDKDKEERLGHYLQSMGFIKEKDITMALSRQFSLPIINLAHQRLNPKALAMVPLSIIRRLRFLPMEYDATGNSLSLVTSDPSLIPTMINLRGILNCDLSIFLGDESTVQELICEADAAAEEIDPKGESQVLASAESLPDLAGLIVERARALGVKSVSVGYFNQLVWTRFFRGDEFVDWVVEFLSARQSQPVGSMA